MLKVETSLLLKCGYVGMIRYSSEHKVGVELNQPHPNGHDKLENHDCKAQHGYYIQPSDIVTKLKLDQDNDYSLDLCVNGIN